MTEEVRDLLTAQPVGADDLGGPQTTDEVRPLPVGAGLAPPADHGPDPSTAGRASPSPTTADEQPAGRGDPPCGARKTDRADADLRFSDRCGNSAFAASAPGGAKAQFPAAPQTTEPVGEPWAAESGRPYEEERTMPVGADDLGGPQTADSVRPSPVGAGLAPPADDRPAGEEHPSSGAARHLPPEGEGSYPVKASPPLGEKARIAARLRPLGGEAVERSETDEGQIPTPELLRSHLASLAVQAESLRAELPGFSLRQALSDPDFLRMTSPAVGLSVRRAWYALHGAELRRAAAEQSALALTGSLASGALRPREGGRGLAAGALSESDPRRWSREQREDVRRRVLEAAARGEKIYPEG